MFLFITSRRRQMAKGPERVSEIEDRSRLEEPKSDQDKVREYAERHLLPAWLADFVQDVERQSDV